MPSKEKDKGVNSADRRVFFAAVFAHGSARVMSKVLSAPLDRIKICLQVQPLSRGFPGSPHLASWHVFKGIVANEGFSALWRGNWAHILGTSLGAGVRLSLLRTTQMWAMPRGDRQYEGLAAYARRCAFLYATGAAALLVAYPFDVAYTCLAADMGKARPAAGNTVPGATRKFCGLWNFMKETRRIHGVATFYKGFPLCLGTALPFVLVATGVHDLLASRLLRDMGHAPEADPSAAKSGEFFWLVRGGAPLHLYPWNVLVGAVSGLAAQSVTYPLDTVRRRWQHACAGMAGDDKPKNVRECARLLYERGGWRAFYAGLGASTAKLLPECVVLCGVYIALNGSTHFV